jgi:antitoxin (DNA-binding transcriptional repressor) of toxin-antitoxin stability system
MQVNVVDIAEAAESLSTLLSSLEEGQVREVVISRAGHPVARITPVESVRIGAAKRIFAASDSDDNGGNEVAKLLGDGG